MGRTKKAVQAEKLETVETIETAEDQTMETIEERTGETAEETGSEKKRDSMVFENEMNYAAAREIMNTLANQKLLTDEEVEEMDEFLRQQFNPVFSSLIAKYPVF